MAISGKLYEDYVEAEYFFFKSRTHEDYIYGVKRLFMAIVNKMYDDYVEPDDFFLCCLQDVRLKTIKV